MSSFCLLVSLISVNIIELSALKEVHGDVNVALISRECNGTASGSTIDEAFWAVERLNRLDIVPEVKLGLSVYRTCTENDEYKAIFHSFEKHEEEFLLGLISDFVLAPKVRKFCAALDINVKETVRCPGPLIRAAVSLLDALGWVENVTVLAPSHGILEEFSKITRQNLICLEDYSVYEGPIPIKNATAENLVVFGNYDQLTAFLQTSEISGAILVALDGSALTDLPDNTYVITSSSSQFLNYTPSPTLFDIAIPLATYALNLRHFMAANCNETLYKVNCLRSKLRGFPQMSLDPFQIVDLLKIEFLTPGINYYVYKSENGSRSPSKLFSYNMFSGNLTELDLYSSVNVSTDRIRCGNGCRARCKNFDTKSPLSFLPYCGQIRIRTESWVFAFLSISLLGVLFCIAILVFLLVSICRRNILEGNPVLTLLLLVSVMLMYCSILPLSLEGNKFAQQPICMARALSLTLSFASAFSLILSRSILLATASKEIGFMSHVAGPVQSFLCLFIFGVQAALSLQVVNRCEDIFRGHFFIYLLSYNAMLLLLLLCLCPLIFKCQRNYREGKYFALATVSISFLWCLWIPAYALLGEKFNDSVLCFGLVSTASALMGTIFVPRTYLMTIAAARDKITSTLPSSLTATTSAMDLYRTGAQPVYDCVNVAAINAVTVARAGLATIQQPDLYSCPNLPDDEDFNLRCDSPINNDKVTRF